MKHYNIYTKNKKFKLKGYLHNAVEKDDNTCFTFKIAELEADIVL